jgi:hypothetical protein
LKKSRFGFEEGLVAEVIGERDLKGAVFEQFGRSGAADRLYPRSRLACIAPKAISP